MSAGVDLDDRGLPASSRPPDPPNLQPKGTLMPKIIEDIPSGVLAGPGRPRKYDWDTLFDGSAWLVEADELTVPPHNFVGAAHQAAKRRGLSLSTSIRPEGVYLLAVKAS